MQYVLFRCRRDVFMLVVNGVRTTEYQLSGWYKCGSRSRRVDRFLLHRTDHNTTHDQLSSLEVHHQSQERHCGMTFRANKVPPRVKTSTTSELQRQYRPIAEPLRIHRRMQSRVDALNPTEHDRVKAF